MILRVTNSCVHTAEDILLRHSVESDDERHKTYATAIEDGRKQKDLKPAHLNQSEGSLVMMGVTDKFILV